MASVMPDEIEHVEAPDVEIPFKPAPVKHISDNVTFNGPMVERPDLKNTQVGLQRTLWARRLMEADIAGNEVELIRLPSGEFALKMDHSVPRDLIPWHLASGSFRPDVATLWGETRKMLCPSWDLSAGAPEIGGSCPAAAAGQGHVERKHREAMLDKNGYLIHRMPTHRLTGDIARKTGAPVKLYEGDETDEPWKMPVCSSCYASLGKYREVQVLLGNTIRWAWVRQMMETETLRRKFEDIIVASMLTLKFPLEAGDRRIIKPVRIHSSGDFFNHHYAACWVNIANKLYTEVDRELVLWCPTRSWAAGSWKEKGKDPSNPVKWWENALGDLESVKDVKAGEVDYPNMIVRCSAYHMGDFAPGALEKHNSVGTTSLFVEDNAILHDKKDERYDVNCPVYAINSAVEAKNCQMATDPITGETGCRVCWRNPDKRVNFTAHG